MRKSKDGHISTLPVFQRSVITKSLRLIAAILWNKAKSRDNYQFSREIRRRCKTVCRFIEPKFLSRIYHVNEMLVHTKSGRMEVVGNK